MAALTGFRKLDPSMICRPFTAVTDIELSPGRLLSKAEEELHETPERREQCLQALWSKISAHPEFNFRRDADFLLRFLRARKFDVDRAFRLLQSYYQTRIQDPEVFRNLLPSVLDGVLSHNLHGFLPHRDPQGRAIFVARIGLGDVSKFPYIDGFRAALLCLEKAIEEGPTQINGIVAIVDFAGLSVAKLRHLITPVNVYRHVNIAQDAFPARFKAAHIINESTVFDVCFALLKPLLSEKNKQRLFVHGSEMASLHKYIPASILPEEFGGELGPFDNSDWRKKLMDSESRFAEDLTYGIRGKETVDDKKEPEFETSSL